VEPQHQQLLLAIKGLPVGLSPTISVLAERLLVRHHSVVELLDRMVERGLVRRERRSADRRQVVVVLTAKADRLLQRIGDRHHRQLQDEGPALIEALSATIRAHPTEVVTLLGGDPEESDD
jgi:DNA-binding MarR family transcriptional regulator